jgi:hypothetical protein
MTERPPCMSDAEYSAWRRINDHLDRYDRAPDPCADCSPDFMGEQAAEGNCALRAAIERRLEELQS